MLSDLKKQNIDNWAGKLKIEMHGKKFLSTGPKKPGSYFQINLKKA